MLNFATDPALLQPLVPPGTELDFFEGSTYLSVVGFRFLQTRVLGIGFPFHRDFDEVNLRFYVRRKSGVGWRRGVVFVREMVPRQAIAFIARTVYGEPYIARPMRHSLQLSESRICVSYSWKRAGRWESLEIKAAGQPQPIAAGSEEEFITEHYWGYTGRRGVTSEFAVEHPRWNVWKGEESRLDADVAALYGGQFVESLSAPPSSAFIAEGSSILVRQRSLLLSS
ncbi:MAG: hypothetical protein JWL59_1699 [Chthoniobacteraceae bacterium]|nr:hypothetical protein [Chthoniobacteraceae bacterium]